MQLLCGIFDNVTPTVSRAYKIIITNEIFVMQCNQHSVLWVHLQLTQATLFDLRAELLRARRCSERETLHLFQPPRADQMPDPLQGQD